MPARLFSQGCAWPAKNAHKRPLIQNTLEAGNGKNLRNVWDGDGRQKGRAVKEFGASSSKAKTVAPRHGFEPRFTAPKAAVLPLDDRGPLGGNEHPPV